MPTYQYKCTDCGQPLEVVQSFSDPALTVCPACEGKLRKVFSSVGVVFKGSGFYRTDSRSGPVDAAPKADTKTETKTDATAASNGKASEKAPTSKSNGVTTGGSGTSSSTSAPAAASA